MNVRERKDLGWALVGVVIVAAAFLLGLAGEGRTFYQSLVAIAFLAAVLLLAFLWHETLQEAKAGRQATRGDRIWNGVVFVVFLSVMLVVAFFWLGF
jgi:hypothetical protein